MRIRNVLQKCFALIAVFGLLFTALFLNGCDKSLSHHIGFVGNKSFAYDDTGHSETTKNDALALIASPDELRVFCDEFNNPAFNENHLAYSTNLSQKIQEYDEAFFSEKSLIIYLGTASHAAKLYKIKRLSIENEQLLLEIRIENYKNGLHILKPWVFFIEVNKSDIE